MHDASLKSATCTEQREVTLLFADLRDFTKLSASLEIEQTDQLLSQVMDCLTAAVVEQGGLVIDYYGDGLAVMWNAPADQPDHPELACRAAMQMIERLPHVAAPWNGMISSDIRLGVGINTGIVQVGNAGSSSRAKYGPRGPNVHLTSRVESITKEIGIPFIVTQQTAELLSSCFIAHRLCRAQMAGILEPVNLYTICQSTLDDSISSMWRIYDAALGYYEQGCLDEAAHALSTIDTTAVEIPAHFLVQQVQRQLGRQQNRRSTDSHLPAPGGVIIFNTK